MTNFKEKFLGITDNEFAFIEAICEEYDIHENLWDFIDIYCIDTDSIGDLTFAVVDKAFEIAIGSGFENWDKSIEAVYVDYQAYRDDEDLDNFFTDFEPVSDYYTDRDICEVFENIIAIYNSIFKGISQCKSTTNSTTYERSTRRR